MDITQFLPFELPLDLIIKVVFLIFISFIVIYALMLLSQVRSFNRVVSLKPVSVSIVPTILTLIYLIAAISLFLLTLVIL